MYSPRRLTPHSITWILFAVVALYLKCYIQLIFGTHPEPIDFSTPLALNLPLMLDISQTIPCHRYSLQSQARTTVPIGVPDPVH